MKIIVACDSFKGSLSSRQAGEACAAGLLDSNPGADVRVVAIGDGGEGTAEALVDGLGGSYVSCCVHDPLGRPLKARYGIAGATAVIELAAASGLGLLTPFERNPLITSTRGTGEMIADALGRGCRRILFGIGGSATNDGGTGLLSALGVRFLDADGRQLQPCGKSLVDLAAVDVSAMMPQAREAVFEVACDVDSPLFGPNGAACVFAPQKGASPDDVKFLDKGLRNYARVVASACEDLPGAGAAGGAGYALISFLNARLTSGISLMLGAIGFDNIIRGADLVITGEGRLDAQTLMGKAPFGILGAARAQGIPVIALGGSVDDRSLLLQAGFTDVRAITPAGMLLDEAMKPGEAAENMRVTARECLAGLKV